MKLGTRGRYAVKALSDVACQAGAKPVSLARIAERQDLSRCYLEQIFVDLRRAGLVKSHRGPGGGYRLTRPCSEISLKDIFLAVEADPAEGLCEGPPDDPCDCVNEALWRELARQVELFFGGITLADVVAGEVSGRARAPSAVQAKGAVEHAETQASDHATQLPGL